jgi:hypothetical protein
MYYSHFSGDCRRIESHWTYDGSWTHRNIIPQNLNYKILRQTTPFTNVIDYLKEVMKRYT